MNFDEYLLLYKYYILLNADKKGWSIYKKDNNIFYLYKKKTKNENFNLKDDMSVLHKKPYDIEKILNEIKK